MTTTEPINNNDKYNYNLISFLIALLSIVIITFTILKIDNKDNLKNTSTLVGNKLKKFWIYGKNVHSGYLNNVLAVLKQMGYENTTEEINDWDLLWAHEYPFRKLWLQMSNLKAHQKVNHFPGCGYITNKVDLATSGLQYIPKAFRLPADKDLLIEYSKQYPNKTFVQKDNNHRHIKIKNLSEINLNDENNFVQEFVDRPLLISGYKFDIGVYTIITSIDPLRVYIYNSEVLLRFCPKKYLPFDPENLDKYIVGDDYLPIWKVPALDYYYNELGFGMKESLNAYLNRLKKNSSKIWTQIEESIRIVCLSQEEKILTTMYKFKLKRNFFELMRFDFVVDEDLNVFLLEANMSPNLSSAHFPPNRLLYQQILYNSLSLVGLAQRLDKNSSKDMIVSYKNIATHARECNSQLCRNSCMALVCQLCKNCISPETEEYLKEAYKEHLDRGDCKRIFPSTLDSNRTMGDLEEYSGENRLQIQWFYGKCLMDKSWC